MLQKPVCQVEISFNVTADCDTVRDESAVDCVCPADTLELELFVR